MSADSRVVSLQFDNKQFQQAVSETLKSLTILDTALNKINRGDSMRGFNKSLSNIDFGGITSGIEVIKNRFSTLGIVGMTIIQRLTNAGIDGLKNVSNALTSQFKQGGMTRALNLEQAKFLLEGLGADVEAVMANVNEAVDGTAYGLDEAAKAAASFSASGVEAGDKMTSALKAVAGTAAMTGADFASIADIYTTVAGQSKLMTMQLRELEGRGLNAAAVLAKSLNKSEAEIRDMVSEGKIDFETFAKAMDDAFGAHAKDANLMFTGALANMKTAISRLGAKFYIPGIVYARDIFNAARDAINNFSEGVWFAEDVFKHFGRDFSSSVVDILTKLKELDTFKKFGDGLSHIFNILIKILKTVKDAFVEAFPKVTVENIAELSDKFQTFTYKLGNSLGSMEGFKNVMVGIFNAFKAAGNIISGLFKILKTAVTSIAGVMGIGDGSLSAGFKELMTSLNDATESAKIFDKVSNIIKFTIERLGDAINTAATTIKDFVGDAVDGMIEKFHTLLDVISEFLNTGSNMAAVITTGGTLGSLGMIGGAIKGFLDITSGSKKTLKEFAEGIVGAFSGIGDNVKNAINTITESFSAMQKELKAKALLEIGIGILAIATGISMLAKLDLDQLAKGMTGAAGAMIILVAAYKKITDIMQGLNKDVKFPWQRVNQGEITLAATSMLLMAGSVLILAKAAQMLGQLNVAELAKGLGATVILLGAVFGMLTGLSKLKVDAAISVKTGIALMAIALALRVMASAVVAFGTIKYKELVQGLKGVIVSLGAIFAFTVGLDRLTKYELPKGIAIYILSIAIAMRILASAVDAFGQMSPEKITQGLDAVMLLLGSMLGISVVLGRNLDAKQIGSLYSVGLAMIGISVGMRILASALSVISALSPEQLSEGLTSIVVSLIAFSEASNAMSDSSKGAGAILLMAVAIGVLAASLKIIGSMDVPTLAKGLITMAIALGIMGAAAAILAPMSAGLLAVGGALLMIGGAVALAGAGILMFAAGLSMLAAVGTAAITTLISMLNSLVIWIGSNIAEIAKIVVKGLVVIFQEIVAQGPLIISSVTKLIEMVIEAVTNNLGKLVDTGILIIETFLSGIAESIPQIASTAATIISGFINGVSQNIPQIIQSGINLMLSFINGLADGIRNNAEAVRAAIWNLCTAILEAFCSFFGIASPSKVMDQQGQNLILGLLKGIGKKIKDVPKKILNGIKNIPGKIKEKAGEFLSSGKNVIEGLLKGLGDKKDKIKGKITDGIDAAKKKLKNTSLYQHGKNIVQGFLDGLNSIKDKVSQFWNWLCDKASAIVEKKNEMHSPSKLYFRYGKYIMQGLVNGLESLKNKPIDALSTLSDAMYSSLDEMDFDSTFSPVITPVVDLSEVNAAAGVIDSSFSKRHAMSINSAFSSRVSSEETLSKSIVDGLKKVLDNQAPSNTYIVDGVTYDDGSNIVNAVGELVRAVKIERRT